MQAGTKPKTAVKRKNAKKSIYIEKMSDINSTNRYAGFQPSKSIYILHHTYNFCIWKAFQPDFKNRTWKNGPRTDTESAPVRTPSPIFLILSLY